MSASFTFPECFKQAKKTLRMKFQNIDNDLLEDGIQYARIEYWIQKKYESDMDDASAFSWFLKVAYYYLSNEIKRSKRFGKLSEAMGLADSSYVFSRISLSETQNFIAKTLKPKNASIFWNHAFGYSLEEIATKENISLNAVKQRHVRARNLIVHHRLYFCF